MEEENLKNLLHDDQAAIQRAEALLSRIANDTAKVDEPYMSKRNKFQREKTQGISPRRDHGEFHDTEIPEPSTYIDDSVGLDSSYLSKVYREKDAPPSASYNSIGFDFALSLAAEKEKGQLLLHDRLEEHSDTHVNMAQCLAIGKEGEQPYGNPATAKKYMNVCFKDKVIGSPQSISVLGDVDKSIAAQMRDEYETWMLLWRLHTGLVESEEVDTFPSCPQAAINQRYYSDRKLQLWNIVVRWYHQLTSERSKLKKSQDISPNAAVSGVYLPCTTEALRKQRKGTLRRIDPDASFKGLILEPDDQDDSIVLLERIWQLITEGAFYTEIDGDFQAYQETLCRQVENICIEAGQPWRAASFSGGMPYRRNPSSLSTTSWQGNAYRALWSDICRRTSYKLGEKTQQLSDSPSDRAQLRATELERVIYACLGGDVENLLRSPLCQDWRQQSWAMFRCVVQSHFDGTCVENRRVLSDALGHIPGPEDPKYENSHAERALSASSFDEHHVFIRTAEYVPKEELQFFRVQRAFIEGRFHALVDRSNAPDNLYDGFDLAEFLCGPDWEVCSILTVARICGVEYVSLYQTAGESLAGRGLSKESFSRMSLESAPCWENESRAFAAQLLRFTAHACIYMSNLTTLSSVVDEECPKSSIQLPTEAIVLAYVQFLLTDDCFLYDRYALVPVFYPSFTSGYHLTLAVQAAMMEAAALADTEVTDMLLVKWQQILGRDSPLVVQAAIQAVRNVRRQLKKKETPSELVRKALHQVRMASENYSSAEEADPNALHLDVQSRITRTWCWLSKPSLILLTRTEMLARANQIIRDFVELHFTDVEEFSVLDRARNFLGTEVKMAMECYECQLREEQQSDQAQEWKLSLLDLATVEREMECWTLFLEADSQIRTWQRNVGWLQQQKTTPSDLPREMFDAAIFVAESISTVIKLRGGWLVDDSVYEFDADADLSKLKTPFDIDQMIPIELDERKQLVGVQGKPGSLRRSCVVYLLNAYVDILAEAAYYIESLDGSDHSIVDLYERCLRISETIMDSDLDLVACFDQNELVRLLEKLRGCAIELVRLKGNVFPLESSKLMS